MFDLISIGDTTIDHYFKIHEAHVSCSVNKQKCELCINYADKIASDSYLSSVAGNAANNAVGITRLKLKTAIYTNVGSDFEGDRIIKHFKDEKIDTKFIKANKDMVSNAASIISFQGERTILVYHQPWSYNLPDLGVTKWVYFSSLSSSFINSNIINELENYLERTGARLAYNPGTFQLQAGVTKNPKLLSLTNLLIVNLKEAKQILSIKPNSDIGVKELLAKLLDLGPKMVVITDGSSGSYGIDGVSYYKLGVFPAKLMEMTGAGDAYASGLVAGLIYGQFLEEAMRWGACNSASVVEHVGAQTGLLTLVEMQTRLKANSKIKTNNF